MNVHEVMSEEPFSVTPETDVVSVAVCMSEHELGALPVCERGHLVGIVTDRDIVFRYLGRGAHEGRLVGHYMTRDPVAIGPDETLERAAELMSQHHVRRLPVCEDGRLVGMIALGDLGRRVGRIDVEEPACVSSRPAPTIGGTR
jgi:CBS domain-containing protein